MTTALLSKLAGKVVTDDIDAEQQQRAKKVLDELGFANVDYVQNNGLTEAIARRAFRLRFMWAAQ